MLISEIKQNVTIIGNDRSVEEVWYWNNPFTKELYAVL